MPSLKQELYTLCREHVEKSILEAESAIEDARESVRNETKSSAGDKYETGREMMQQEIELNTHRIAELHRMKAALGLISLEPHEEVQPGSIVTTSLGDFFMSISLGKITVDGKAYHTLTQSAPLGAQLMGKRAGDTLNFNGKEIRIVGVQ